MADELHLEYVQVFALQKEFGVKAHRNQRRALKGPDAGARVRPTRRRLLLFTHTRKHTHAQTHTQTHTGTHTCTHTHKIRLSIIAKLTSTCSFSVLELNANDLQKL